jgi:hypothetical protein
MFAPYGCTTGFIGLSVWASYKEGVEFHADPQVSMTFCRALTPVSVCATIIFRMISSGREKFMGHAVSRGNASTF